MITVVGSLNYDLVTTAKRIPEGGETVYATAFDTHHGGKGANEARAVSRLSPKGLKVAMVGCVGEDQFGDELIDGLENEGVDVSKVFRSKEKTGTATILVDENGENRILVNPAANADMTVERISPGLWQDSEYVLLQNEIPVETTIKVLQLASQTAKTVYNPSPILDLPRDIFTYVDYLIVNEIEAGMIVDNKETSVKTKEDAYSAAERLLDLGVRTAVVITLGAKGAVYASKSDKGHVPAATIGKVIDTTGAGDTFLAGLVSKLAVNAGLKQSLEFAAKASGIVVTKKGAASSIPTLAEVEGA